MDYTEQQLNEQLARYRVGNRAGFALALLGSAIGGALIALAIRGLL